MAIDVRITTRVLVECAWQTISLVTPSHPATATVVSVSHGYCFQFVCAAVANMKSSRVAAAGPASGLQRL